MSERDASYAAAAARAAPSPSLQPVPAVPPFIGRPLPPLKPSPTVKRNAKWYHGGVASAMAVCFTHPFDLVKVQLQTQQEGKLKIIPLTKSIVKRDGILALYNGISASLLRQLTYSTARFGIYEALRPKDAGKNLSFAMKCLTAGAAGGFGGFVGAPADLINVRMQNDSKLPVQARRNYKNALEGLVRVSRQEGVAALWRGSSMVVVRAVLMTIGQLSFYDQVKQMLLLLPLFKDTVSTHLLASSIAAGAATTITLPVDVMKTRLQNAKPGEYKVCCFSGGQCHGGQQVTV
ncbi:hypothetical protein RvY_18990-2 [Ramazzottius varieornatus]|uniref:Mitochondrial dicarboxylate carrier n=1 Tax=Ramazzottius varieornatus TaxID=947166 RepID=A0A1D1W7Z1_RAMVA|nr:hypothetical protein RvY_18990-2 [Ramazzottius varieornatus]